MSQGPRGELAHSVDKLLEIRQAEDGSVRLAKRGESRKANEQHGLWRRVPCRHNPAASSPLLHIWAGFA